MTRLVTQAIRRTRSSVSADQALQIGMTAQLDYREFDTAALEEVMRQAHAAYTMRQQPAGAPSATNSASAGDNVVRYPALQSPQPGQVHGPQGSGAAHHGQAVHDPATMEKAALVRLVKEVLQSANDTRNWYNKNASSVKKWSRGSRSWAISLGVLGSLCHLLPVSLVGSITSGFEQPAQAMIAAEAKLGALGLIFYMLAGSWLLYDQVFGFSTSWMRYRLAELRLGKLIGSFTLDVEAELAKCGGRILPADRADRIFARLKDFLAEVDKVKIEETETWIAEFKASLLQIDQVTKASGKSVQGKK
jgi:hypothetical protein